jgi:hypothetical protein
MTADTNAGARGKCANCAGKIAIPAGPAGTGAPSAAPAAKPAAKPPAKRAASLVEPATVQLTWGRVIGSLEKLDVLLDGVPAVSAKPGQMVEIPVAPGHHRLTVASPSRQCSKDFTAKPLQSCCWRLQYGLAELSLLPAWEGRSQPRPVIGKIGGLLALVGGLAIVGGMLFENVFKTPWADDLTAAITPQVASLCFVLGTIVFVTGGVLGVLSRTRSRAGAVGEPAA